MTERPARLIVLPNPLTSPPPAVSFRTDPLSDVLRAIRLNGAFFYHVEAIHPWSVQAAPAVELVPRVLPGAENLVSYHIVTEGSCWGGLDDTRQFLLEPGDAIVFPQGDPHFVSSVEGMRLTHGSDYGAPDRYLETVRVGSGGGPRVNFVCGFLGCDLRPFNPLIASLPRVLHVPQPATGWLAEFPRQVVAESRRERGGGATLLTSMAEVMFVEVLRRYMESTSAGRTGWLAALKDPIVGPALGQLHDRPAYAWSLAELARAANTSRSVLSERFSEVMGMPPMQYLAQWRLQLAAEQLSSGSEKVATVGARVGYDSEAAFSRAFKRATGLSPASWRRSRSGTPAVGSVA